jgi:flagellar biosynthesis chaperone FliJ
MSKSETTTDTQHALLVIWGLYAQALGLIPAILKVAIEQKTVDYSPHTKILEFFLAILAGLEHLQELNTAAEPLVKDPAVAQAWLQPGWAHHSGVSRTLTHLTQSEAEQIVQVVEQLEKPFLDRESLLALASQGELILDGDLTPRPVSDTSRTYPGAAFGHMDDKRIGLGYQSAQVSVRSPTFGRLLLSSSLHPGDVVSSSQTQSLVRAAETRLGFYPLRRTDLVQQRLQAQRGICQTLEQDVSVSQQEIQQVLDQLALMDQQINAHPTQLAELASVYQAKGRKVCPFGALTKLQNQLGVLQRKRQRLQKKLPKLHQKFKACQQKWEAGVQSQQQLRQWLEQLQAENAQNPFPIRAKFRLDAGFGNRESILWLIEMGYEVFSRPYSNWLLPRMKALASQQTWQRVGKNAELIVWKQQPLEDFPYRLDLALERFHTGEQLKHKLLLHFGEEPVTENPGDWFNLYNARQTLEAGIKEGKQVFGMHYFKIRSPVGLYLQEQLGRFAANFVRFAAQWMEEQCLSLPNGWEDPTQPKVKQQVKVGAHTSAVVEWSEQGGLLRFTDHSVFAGRSLQVTKAVAIQLALPFSQKVQT